MSSLCDGWAKTKGDIERNREKGREFGNMREGRLEENVRMSRKFM